MKYIVMECHPAYAVLMDEEGRFVKAANCRYEVGQTVTEPVLERARTVSMVKTVCRAMVALAACLLIVWGIAHFVTSSEPYSSVIITINPMVKLDLDRDGLVIDVEGLNEDGKTLVNDYDFENKQLTAVTGDLLDRAMLMGFLSDGDTVNFDVDCPDAAQKMRYQQALGNRTVAQLEGRTTVLVEVDGVAVNEPSLPTESSKPRYEDDEEDDDDREDSEDDSDEEDDD